jgi:hypothetical protein
MRKLLIICALAISSLPVFAQELRATVRVLSPEVQATNKDIFTALESSMQQFLNGYAFTDHKYADEERIECTFILNVKSLNGNRFDATLQVQYSRPIFNSSYSSPVLNIMDKDVVFSYAENEPIEFQKNSYTNNLSSILAFYSYAIIGADRSTFKANGGAEEWAICQQIVTAAQSSGGASGWKSFDGNKNRFWIADQINSPAFQPVLDCWYNYHRQGLDLMHDPAEHPKALATISQQLMNLDEVNKKRPNSYVLNLFFDAKNTEIIQLFSTANTLGIDTRPLRELLESIDRTHASSYAKLGE